MEIKEGTNDCDGRIRDQRLSPQRPRIPQFTVQRCIKICLTLSVLSLWASGRIASFPTICGISSIFNICRHPFPCDMSVSPLTGNLSCRLSADGDLKQYTDSCLSESFHLCTSCAWLHQTAGMAPGSDAVDVRWSSWSRA